MTKINTTALKNPWFYATTFLVFLLILVAYKTYFNKPITNTNENGLLIPSSEKNLDNSASLNNDNLDTFAQCLSDSDAKMYGTEWCGYCKKQKELFGDSFQYVDYTDCDKDRDSCSSQNIEGYPTWKINGNSFPGVQSLEDLSQKTSCPL